MDFSIPRSILTLQQVAVLNLPRTLLSVHIPIQTHPQVPTIQAICKDGISALVRQEGFLVVVGLVTPLLLRVRYAETVSREYHDTAQVLLSAFGGVAVLVVETPHSLTEFAPSNLRHNSCFLSI